MIYSAKETEEGNPYRDALRLLRHVGWTKGISRAPDGRRCLIGADMSSCDNLLMGVVREQFPDRIHYDPSRSTKALGVFQKPDAPISYEYGALANFNNHPDTVFSDIELVLEKTAVRYEERV